MRHLKLFSLPSIPLLALIVSGCGGGNSIGHTTQTITFVNPGTQTVGVPLTLSAEASSEAAVTLTSTTPSVCTLSGAAATFVTAGTCTIDASQSGNHTYAAASQNPWIVDPQHYKIQFKNSEVRVTRGRIGPKEETPLHEHSLNRVFVYLTKMDFRVVPEGKKPEHTVQKECATAWGTPIRHTEYNLSGKRFEAVVIEPKC